MAAGAYCSVWPVAGTGLWRPSFVGRAVLRPVFYARALPAVRRQPACARCQRAHTVFCARSNNHAVDTTNSGRGGWAVGYTTATELGVARRHPVAPVVRADNNSGRRCRRREERGLVNAAALSPVRPRAGAGSHGVAAGSDGKHGGGDGRQSAPAAAGAPTTIVATHRAATVDDLVDARGHGRYCGVRRAAHAAACAAHAAVAGGQCRRCTVDTRNNNNSSRRRRSRWRRLDDAVVGGRRCRRASAA